MSDAPHGSVATLSTLFSVAAVAVALVVVFAIAHVVWFRRRLRIEARRLAFPPKATFEQAERPRRRGRSHAA